MYLGDVTVGRPTPRLDPAFAAPPGNKLLAAGNHAFVCNREAPEEYGVRGGARDAGRRRRAALPLTHEPLGTIPAGCVDIRAAARQRVGREVATPSMTAEGGTSSDTGRGVCIHTIDGPEDARIVAAATRLRSRRSDRLT